MAGEDFTSSFLAFFAGGGAVLLVCVGVVGRLGVTGVVTGASPDNDSGSVLLVEYRSRTWWQISEKYMIYRVQVQNMLADV